MKPPVYGCCVGEADWDAFTRWVVPSTRHRALLALGGQRSIAAAYNTILDWAQREHTGRPLVLLHADLEVKDQVEAEADVVQIFTEDDAVDLIGVAGARDVRSLSWWDYTTVGHQVTDRVDIHFPIASGPVEILEGSFLAFSPEAVASYRFDSHFPGFHGYDELTYRAHRNGAKVVVAEIETHHHNLMGYRSAESAAQWAECNRLFIEKWGLA